MPLADPMLLGHPWTFWLGWAWTLSSVVLTTWIVLQRRAPVSTLAWIMVLNLMPVLGLVVYHYFGPRRVRRQRLKRWHQKAVLMSQSDLAALNAEHPQAPLWARQHARLIETACGIAPSSARSLELLGSGGATLQALLAEIAQARWHIHLEYYIFDPDQTGTQLLHALTERARAGVQVRLLVDAIGSARLLARRQRALLQLVRDAGGELADGGHLLGLHQLFLRTGQAHQRLAQLGMAALQFLLARMRLADIVEDHHAVATARTVVEIRAHLQHDAVGQGQVGIPAAGRACGADRLRRQQGRQRRQRVVLVVDQRARRCVGMQRTAIATEQQVAVVHQFGQRLEVGEAGDVLRRARGGRGIQGRGCGHGCIGWRRWGASIRRGRGSGKVRGRSFRIRHRAQATASGRSAEVVEVWPCAS